MTIEALRARRAQLREQKRLEQELIDRGEGDNMALFMVNEELLEVNAQIRSLTSSTPHREPHHPAPMLPS